MTFKIFYYGSIYIIIVGYLQYFDPFNLGRYLSLFYTAESQLFVAIDYEIRRITVVSENPNDGAVLTSYFILFNFFSFLFTNNKKNLLFFFLLIGVLFFTQSRTVLIATLFALVFIFMTLKGYWLKKFFLLIILLFLLVVLYPLFDYIFIGFQLFLNGENLSFNVRLENMKKAYEIFLGSPIFGIGIAKGYFNGFDMDSEWLSLLSNFGLIGIITVISLLFYPFIFKRQIDKINGINLKIIYFTLISSSLVGSLVMVTNNFITGYQTFLPWLLLMVLSIRLVKYYRIKNACFNNTL
ncbi:O-antigen ligase family protein [Halarcobacter sp.]|uniref:O-antigen ligase family protein n=1 Tax=Halarcobacter sp. TaxID=2321133 RepID=UPI003A93F7ED